MMIEQTTLESRFRCVRKAINLQRPDRMPLHGEDYQYIEYRKDVYHLGEMDAVVVPGEVVTSKDGKRKYTADGGVWAVDAKEKYKDYDDVLNVNLDAFEVEDVSPAMLGEMARLYAEKASQCFPVPFHYSTLLTRATIEFGSEMFLLAFAVDPERVSQILDRFGQASLAVVQGWAQLEGTELIVIHDDIAATRGLLIRPEWLRRYVFPWYSRLFAAARTRGRKVIYISDGNYLAVLDDILATRANGLFIETTSMDPRDLMARAGQDNLYRIKSDSRNMDLGTPQDVYAEFKVLRDLHAAYPGILLSRGGENPKPDNLQAFNRFYRELLVYA